MLASAHRMRASDDFRRTVRRGVRSGGRTVVVHALPRAAGGGEPTIVGFVVSTQVGNAVVRNRVKRRLRHLARPLLAGRTEGMQVVVRALPAAASAGAELATDLAAAWDRCMAKVAQR